MASIREIVKEGRQSAAATPARSRVLPFARRHPRGAFVPAPVGVSASLLLALLLIVSVAIRL